MSSVDREVFSEGAVGLSGDVALEAADDFSFGLAFCGSAKPVGCENPIVRPCGRFGTV